MMKSKIRNQSKHANSNGSSRCVQRVVRRLVRDWRSIASRKEAFAKRDCKYNNVGAFRAMGIASAFRYCAARLEWEMTPNAPHEPRGAKTDNRESANQ